MLFFYFLKEKEHTLKNDKICISKNLFNLIALFEKIHSKTGKNPKNSTFCNLVFYILYIPSITVHK